MSAPSADRARTYRDELRDRIAAADLDVSLAAMAGDPLHAWGLLLATFDDAGRRGARAARAGREDPPAQPTQIALALEAEG